MTADKRKEILSKAKPILFDTEMVRAILDGRKIVTRRAVKPQPIAKIAYCFGSSSDSDVGKWAYPGDAVCEHWGDDGYRLPSNITQEELCRKWTPPCNTDDILYVRESFFEHHGKYEYKADGKHLTLNKLIGGKEFFKWQPSSRMPKEAARIFLKVTNVRVERLQDITAQNIRDEGLTSVAAHCGDMEIALSEFAVLWNSTVKKKDLGKYGWDADPWVWVVEFERIN